MKVTKGSAFLLGLSAIIGLSVFACLYAEEETGSVIRGAVIGIVGMTTAFIGGNVADNGVKGKYYNPNLDHEHRGDSL